MGPVPSPKLYNGPSNCLSYESGTILTGPDHCFRKLYFSINFKGKNDPKKVPNSAKLSKSGFIYLIIIIIIYEHNIFDLHLYLYNPKY